MTPERADQLMDAWNARNATAAAAGYGLARSFDSRWSAPAVFMFDIYDIGSTLNSFGAKLLHGSCGSRISVDPYVAGDGYLLSAQEIEDNRKHQSLTRLFDEAHMMLRHSTGEPLMYEVDGITHRKPENKPMVWQQPPNHGAGAICTCIKYDAICTKTLGTRDGMTASFDLSADSAIVVATSKREAMKLARLESVLKLRAGRVEIPVPLGETVYTVRCKPKKNCRWCNGTGRNDFDRCGRGISEDGHVSRTHEAGGYADWCDMNLNEDGIHWNQIYARQIAKESRQDADARARAQRASP